MMPSGVVSFRVDEKDLKALKKKGINPNAFAKEAFEGKLRRLSLAESIEWFKAHPVRLAEPVEKTVREMRDSR